MASKSSNGAVPEVLPTPQPGEACPCCGRQVPKNAKPKLTPEEQRERRREYNNRPEVIERRKAYQAKMREERRELRELKKRLESEMQAQAEGLESLNELWEDDEEEDEVNEAD